MGSFLYLLSIVTIGIVLLWFGYSLYFGQYGPLRFAGLGWWSKKSRRKSGTPGDPQVCPVCSAILYKGELVSSHAFPSITGGIDRLMYIRGCYNCLNGKTQRFCPVCRKSLENHEILISRMFERPGRRNHVHVIGCSHCKRVGSIL